MTERSCGFYGRGDSWLRVRELSVTCCNNRYLRKNRSLPQGTIGAPKPYSHHLTYFTVCTVQVVQPHYRGTPHYTFCLFCRHYLVPDGYSPLKMGVCPSASNLTNFPWSCSYGMQDHAFSPTPSSALPMMSFTPTSSSAKPLHCTSSPHRNSRFPPHSQTPTRALFFSATYIPRNPLTTTTAYKAFSCCTNGHINHEPPLD